MTADKYVRETVKRLQCRTSKKKKIKQQLLSDINSAVENGESLENVLKRMGTAWDCASRLNDQFDKKERKAAKREKTLKIWGTVLIVIAVLAGVAYWNLPKWSDISESTVFEEEQVKVQAQDIIQYYSDNDFETVVEYMDDEMKQVLNAATLQYTKEQMGQDLGELIAFGTMYVSEAVQRDETYAMVQVSVSYANGSAAYTITFDEDMELAGFYVK